jgi:hypothetical protein
MDKFKSLRRTGLKTVTDSTSHSLSRLKFNEKELSKIATVCIPDKEGLVEKKGPGKGQGYKPRWLRLKGNLLFYFKLLESGDVDSNGPAGLLILESCCPERTHKDDKPFAFTISFTNDKSRVYKFSAHSEQDANSWVEVLRNASYEQLRMRVYHLQKEISKRTGMDPLIGLASKVKRQKSTLLRSTRMKSSSTVRVFRPVDAHRTPFSFSSLDAPLFEVHLSCRGLPLSPTGSPPSTLIRSSISLGPGGTTKALCETEIVEESCNPMFFSVVMLEVTREAARCGVVRFELESVTSDTTDTCSIAPTQDNSEPEVCLLAALVGYGEVPLESLLNYPATSDCGIVDVPLSSSSGAGVGVLTVQIRKAKEVMEYCDQNMRTRRSTIVKRADTVQGLQLPVKNIHFCPFQFPTNHHTTLKVLEELSESVFNLQVPLQLLKCYIKEDRQRIKDISELGHLGLGWASTIESFKTLLVESVQEYQQSIDRMNTALLQDECNFKSSTEKKERDLQFVPCNLHIQVLRVSECGGSGHFSEQNGSGQFSEHKGSTNVSGQPPKENCYVTVTFGAASDHVSGFKHGGVKALLKEARNQPSFISGCHKYGEILFQLGKIRENIYDYKNFLFRAAANQNSEEMSDAMQGISNGIQLLLQMLQNSAVDKAIQDLRSARANHLRSSTPLSPPAFSKCQCKFTSTNDWVWNGKRFIQVSTDWEGSVAVQSVNKYLIKLLETVEKGSRLIVELRHEAHASSINQLQIRYKPSYCWSYALLSAFRKLNQTLEGIFTVVESSVCFAMVQSDSRVQSVKEIRHRRDVVFSQILTALMTGFYQSLSEHLKDGQFLEQMKKLGYLAHFQSFLSDQGDEASMLEDMHIAVLELRTVSFQVLNQWYPWQHLMHVCHFVLLDSSMSESRQLFCGFLHIWYKELPHHPAPVSPLPSLPHPRC